MGLKGTAAVEHFIEDDPNRPNVCVGSIGLSSEHFGGHIQGRSQHSPRHAFHSELFAEAEVGYLKMLSFNEDIFRLEIPMHDIVLSENLEASNKLIKYRQSPLLL